MAYVLGFVVVFVYVMAFSLCRISGHYSRMEEAEEERAKHEAAI